MNGEEVGRHDGSEAAKPPPAAAEQLMAWTADMLDVFVATSDQLGGPDAAPCQAFWQNFVYQPSFQVDRSLDPFGPGYAAHQMKLYEELAGHPYRLEQDEQTAFDLKRHVAAVNPYDHADATMMGVHLQRLAHVFRCAQVRRGELLLDMGCGWGLSSEVAAYIGLRVLGVDINPDFVSLVNRRAARTSYPISAVRGTFDGFSSPEPVDLVLFYECLHHAVDPLVVVSRYAAALRPGGRMLLAGEPINAIWWPHWGMRLDPLSIYCIRKSGWFESGWSIDYIQEVMRRAGLVPVVHSHGDPIVGPAIVAEKPMRPVPVHTDPTVSLAAADLAEQARALTEQRDGLAARLEAARRDIDSLAEQARALTEQRDGLAARLEAARRDIAAVHASTSWRLTRPLRGLKRLLG